MQFGKVPLAQLKVRPSPFNYVMAISHFARALGAARSGAPEAAQADVAKLAELSGKLRDSKDLYWAEIVDIQRQVAAVWVLHAQGKYDEALKAMSAAADAEDRIEKHAVTPGPLAPARASSTARCCSSAAWPRRHWRRSRPPRPRSRTASADSWAPPRRPRGSATAPAPRSTTRSSSRLRPPRTPSRPELAAARKFLATN